MSRISWIPSLFLVVAIGLGAGIILRRNPANAAVAVQDSPVERVTRKPYQSFELDVLVNGRPVAEYFARGRT